MSDPTVTGAARMACDLLREMRAAHEHELGDRIEADLAEAVRIVLRAASPRLHDAIAHAVAEAAP
jgi:hypothetical protein